MARKTIMNKLTSPELLAQVNPDNINLMNDFLEYLESTQRAETTIAQYKSDLQIAFVWALQHNNNAFYCDWTKRNIVKLQNWLLNENQNSPARVRRFKASLSSIGNYVENVLDDEYPNFRNIIRKIESPLNQAVRQKTVFEDDDIVRLMNTLVDRKRYETACMVALAAYGGRRKAELCRFKVSDFADDKLVCDGALYKSDPIKTKGRGNGKYINCYTLAKKFKPYLDMWLKDREAKGIESEWLFPDKNDMAKHMKVTRADSFARTCGRILGADFYWHSLRHFFTTSLSKAGIPDGVIQTIVAWDSAEMLKIYKDLDAEDEIGMYFKGGEISAPEQKNLSDL